LGNVHIYRGVRTHRRPVGLNSQDRLDQFKRGRKGFHSHQTRKNHSKTKGISVVGIVLISRGPGLRQLCRFFHSSRRSGLGGVEGNPGVVALK